MAAFVHIPVPPILPLREFLANPHTSLSSSLHIYETFLDAANVSQVRIRAHVIHFISAVRNLLKGLMDINHWTGGSIFDTILVTPQHGVSLIHGSVQAPSKDHIGYDGQGYFLLVKSLLTKMPSIGNAMPLRAAAFVQLDQLSLRTLYDLAYFSYHHPILWNEEGDLKFIYKLIQLRFMNSNMFDSNVMVRQGIFSMMDWYSRVQHGTLVLSRIVKHNHAMERDFYSKGENLLWYIRNVLCHFQEPPTSNWTTRKLLDDEFHTHFWDLVPKVYIGVLRGLVYHSDQTFFKQDLVEFFRLTPFPLQ